MSALLLLGWLLAVAAASVLLMSRRAARRSTERVVRACHELRGPLQNVMLALDAGADGRGPTASAAPATLAALAAELTRARGAVEDLSAAAAGGVRRDEVRQVELFPLVRDLVAVHDLAARARGRRVVLLPVTTAAPTVVGDRARLAQAIGNLVQNAVEHGAGTVRVGVGGTGDRVHVEVADEGHGLRVPIEHLVRSGRRRGQRGRGMRIVSDALVAHGGRLRSAPSAAGARMVAELPVARPRTAAR
jgi:signal transduction histidine kinase